MYLFYIQVHDNRLTELPVAIGNLENLNKLILR